MWKEVSNAFTGLPAQRSVVRKMIELGLRIDDEGRIKCGDVEIKENSLANVAKVDRRIVAAVVEGILKTPKLKEVFSNIQPAGTLLKDVAPLMGFGVVEIEADAKQAGIIASATKLMAEKQLMIRQIYAKDPELFENPTLCIITEKEIPGNLLNLFKKIKGVRKVSIY